VQPRGGTNLTKMPEDLYGVWYSKDEGWKIDDSGITSIDLKTDAVENKTDTTYTLMPLTDSMRIYRANDFYFINYREKSQYWEIFILESLHNGDINYFEISDPKIFSKVKGIKLVEANYSVDGETRTVKTLAPDITGHLEFESAIFSGQMKIESLRKSLSAISPIVLRNDGTIYIPEKD
jgi:hypothetical protein